MGRISYASGLALWCVALPGLAWAGQGVAAGVAPLELGVGLGSSSESPTLAPIAVLNLGPRDALEVSAAISLKNRGQFAEDLYSVQYRRTIFRANRGAIALTAGGSFLKSEWHDEYEFRGRFPALTRWLDFGPGRRSG